MGMDEMPLAEFVTRRKINPYVNPRANFRGNELFWTLMDMMLLCEEERRQVPQPLDVSHIMWVELRFAVYNRKVPIYGLYLNLLISKTWEKMFPGDEFLAPD